MDPEVLNISVDDNDADTSQDELDEDPDFCNFFSSPLRKNYICREKVSSTGEFAKLFKDWERPTVQDGALLYSSSDTESQPECFRFMFLDSVSTISGIKHGKIKLDQSVKDNLWHCVIRLFGVARVPVYSASQDLFEEPDFMDPKNFDSRNSASVCVNVHGFIPYFYALPQNQYFYNDDKDGYAKFSEMRTHVINKLNDKVAEAILRDITLVHVHNFVSVGQSPVVRIEGVPLQQVQNSIFDFPTGRSRDPDSLLLKVYVALPMFVSIAARILDEFMEPCVFDIFEANLTNNIRFLADRNLPGCTWLELKAGRYYHRKNSTSSYSLELESHCQIELDVHCNDIVTMSEQPKDIPPLRILSFDLECRLKENNSAKSKVSASQVIQVGAVLSSYSTRSSCDGEDDDPIIGKAIFVLGTCAKLPDARVVQFYDKANPNNNSEENLRECEAVMLASFRDFVIQMDPDIITGYNIKNFDFPHLFDRAEGFYNEFEEVKRFPFLGRLRKIKSSIRPIMNPCKKMYRYDSKMVNIQGRIIMDMYLMFNRHNTGRNRLKLKHVAKKYLKAGEEKDDVKYTEINSLQDGDEITRRRLAHYCVQDSYLPVKLMLVRMPDRKAAQQDFIQYYFENSRLGGTIIRYLVNKSREYNKYFKQVRVQKNNGRVKYHPDSPSPKKLLSSLNKAGPSNLAAEKEKTTQQKKTSRMLFTDDDD